MFYKKIALKKPSQNFGMVFFKGVISLIFLAIASIKQPNSERFFWL